MNFVILIRSLDKHQMGTWALFLIVTTVFEVSKTNLLKNAHIRFTTSSSDPEARSGIASSSMVINALISIGFIALIVLFSGPLSRALNAGDDLALMLQWFIPGLILMIFFAHLEAVQQAHMDFKGVFAGYFIRQISFFLLLVYHFITKEPITIINLAIYQSISIFLGVVVIFLFSRKYLLFRFNPSRFWMKKIMGYGGYIFGSGFLSNIFANMDQILTAYFLLPADVAHYNAAQRINQFIDVPSFAAAEILFPKVSQASAEEGTTRVKYLYERMVAILLSFTIPAALFIICFPHFVINIIAGREYGAAALILQIYMVLGLLRPMQNQAANILNSIGKPELCFYLNGIFMFVNLGINYACLKQFGFYGAAIGTLITCLLGFVAWYVIMKKHIGFEMGQIFKYILETYKMIYTQALNLISKTKQVHA